MWYPGVKLSDSFVAGDAATVDPIIVQLREGRSEALVLIYREHEHAVRAFARRLLGVDADAEELVQDLFYRLWQDRERTSITTSLKSYLFTAVRNRCHNGVKQQGRLRAPTEHDDHAVETADPLEGMERGARIQADHGLRQ